MYGMGAEIGNYNSLSQAFAGIGRRRTAAATAVFGALRRTDQELAARLAGAGLDPYKSEGEITVVDLLNPLSTESRGRQLRPWRVFNVAAAAEQRRVSREYRAFMADQDTSGPPVHVVVRPPEHVVELSALRTGIRDGNECLNAMLGYLARRRGLDTHILALEILPMGDGSVWDIHYHIVMAPTGAAELEVLQRHVERRGWTFWADPDAASDATAFGGEHAARLAGYVSKGAMPRAIARAELSDAALVELVRQTDRLKFVRARGAFREFRSRLARERLRIVETEDEEGQVACITVPRRRIVLRRRELFRTTSTKILAVRPAWIGDELRPCLIVENYKGWSELLSIYRVPAAQFLTGGAPVPLTHRRFIDESVHTDLPGHVGKIEIGHVSRGLAREPRALSGDSDHRLAGHGAFRKVAPA